MSKNLPGEQVVISTETETLAALARDFMGEWKLAHGAPNGTAHMLVGSGSLAIHLEDAFTRAELNLATQSSDPSLVEEYVGRLWDQVCHNMASRIESATQQRVISTGTSLNLKAGWLMCFYKLGPTRSLSRKIRD